MQLSHIQDFAMSDWVNQVYIGRVNNADEQQQNAMSVDESGQRVMGNVVHEGMTIVWCDADDCDISFFQSIKKNFLRAEWSIYDVNR